VADLGRAQNLGVPDLLVDGDRVGLRLARLDGGEPAPSLEFQQLCEERKRAQAEEEDRILYVAMTRARERLLLSAAVDFEQWPEPRQGGPAICWLGPALAADLPARVRGGVGPVLDLAVTGSAALVRCRLNSPARAAAGPPTPPPRALPAARERRPPSAVAPPAFGGAVANAGGPRPGEQPEQMGTLSYTTLSELERCGYRHYLQRVLGLPDDRSATRARPAGDGLGARSRGTLVHRLLESIDFSRATHPPAAVARVAREFGLRVGRREREEIAALVAAASAGPPAARVAAAKSAHREHPFAFSLGEGQPLMTGAIDVLAREADGGYLVLDYKSDRVAANADLDALVERDYGLQRLVYAIAVLRAGAPKVEIVHWFLERPDWWVASRHPASELGALERRLRARIARARARAVLVSEHPHRGLCESCPGRAGLCSWSEAETLRELPETPAHTASG
jgi:ATP-dependent exoDNAse (exonuclease V) beta subunit